MSGSPVLNLRRVQMAVKNATGLDVSTVDLCHALLVQMGATNKIALDRTSLKVHHARLLNWQIADSVVMEALASLGGRLSQSDINRLYDAYVPLAEKADLVPMAPATFRLRAYAAPAPTRPRRAARVF
jgi:hypothetical protein